MSSQRRGSLNGPLVVLDVEHVRHSFVLVLLNIGQDVAFRPRVGFSRKLVGAGGGVLVSDLPLWSSLTLLVPGRRIEVFLDAAELVLSRGPESGRFTATISYADADGRDFKHAYDHDLSAYRELPQLEPER